VASSTVILGPCASTYSSLESCGRRIRAAALQACCRFSETSTQPKTNVDRHWPGGKRRACACAETQSQWGMMADGRICSRFRQRTRQLCLVASWKFSLRPPSRTPTGAIGHLNLKHDDDQDEFHQLRTSSRTNLLDAAIESACSFAKKVWPRLVRMLIF
jgi:hypothetical protein